MKWITRQRPKIDRIACPWLIKRFIDPEAEILLVPDTEVITQAQALSAIPFDIPGVEYTHYGSECTFDYFLKKHSLNDPALHAMAPIIRGADTDDHTLAPQTAGLWAISAGLAFNITDDDQLLEQGMHLYDALYSWAKYLQRVKHIQTPIERLLMEALQPYLQPKGKKIPVWVNELKELIQDQTDTNLALSLKELSESLDVNPAYLSREFSKYFDNLSFGEYMRKLRIEKAIELLQTSRHTLVEIAYLAGFSDQSHFTRIFKKHTGQNPSDFRKSLSKK